MNNDLFVFLSAVVITVALIFSILYTAAWLGISVGQYGSLHMVIVIAVMKRFATAGFLLLMFYHAVSAGLRHGPKQFFYIMNAAFKAVHIVNERNKQL